MKKTILIAGSIVLLIIAGVYIFQSMKTETKEKNQKESIKLVIDTTKVASIPFILAKNKGFFDEENLDVEFISLKKGEFLPELLIHGDVDIGAAAVAAELFNAYNQGAEFYIVADNLQNVEWLMIRNDLADNNSIETLKDLKGKTIRTSGEGKGNYYALGKMLEGVGLDITRDVKLSKLENSETLPALESKRIDAALVGEPYRTIAIDKNLVEMFSETGPRYQIMTLVASKNMITNRSDGLKGFLRAYLRGVEIYNKAKDGKEPEHSEIKLLISQTLGVDPEFTERMLWHYVDPRGKPDVDSIKDVMDYFHKLGLIDKTTNLDEFINLEFLPQAI